MTIPANTRQQAQDLLDFIDASPSPWHAVATCEQRLQAAGFARLDETERWTLQAGDKRYVVRGDAAIIAFVVGSAALAESGLRIIGAHTDSPGLRIKPRPAEEVGGMVRLGVEVYGGPILATFAEFEADLIKLRTREGMAVARAKGKLRGKKPKLSDRQQKELRRMYDTGDYSISDLAELFSISRPTVYRTLGRQPVTPAKAA